jgi:hypothetical protein
MKCRKVIDLIPLFAGSDLSEKMSQKVQRHLQNCRSCQQEYTEYQSILQQTREWLVLERTDWEEPEWNRTVQAAIEKGETKRSWLVPWPFKKGWAVVLMAASAILLSLLVLHPAVVRDKPRKISRISAVEPFSDIMSMTLVSKETGLKINWFFHKELKLEVME